MDEYANILGKMNVLNMFCKDAFNSEILWINENNVNILSGNELEAIKSRIDATDIYFIQSLSALKYGLSDGPFGYERCNGQWIILYLPNADNATFEQEFCHCFGLYHMDHADGDCISDIQNAQYNLMFSDRANRLSSSISAQQEERV